MIDFSPFKGVYFNKYFFNTEQLVPASLAISGSEIEKYRKKRNHAIQVVYPENLKCAKPILDSWLKENILIKETKPAFYSLRQEYKIPGENKSAIKEGVIGLLKITREGDEILMHENVIDAEVDNLVEYFEQTNLQSSTATGFYLNKEDPLGPIIKDSLKKPISVLEENDSISTIGVITEIEKVRIIQEVIKTTKLYLADGHHRNTALKKIANNSSPVYLMILLVNANFSDFTVLPIHRTFSGLTSSKENILEKAKEDFFIEKVDGNISKLPEKKNFYLILNNKEYKLTLKSEKVAEIPWKFPDIIKDIDHTVIHYFLFEKYLGIKGIEQKKSSNIKFCFIFTDCIETVKEGFADLAIILGKIDLEVIIETAESGFTFPQKSTYFYPKLPSGLLFSTVNNN